MAPEILEGVPYDTRVDIWSMGVNVFTMLGGYPPFDEDDDLEMSQKIRKGDYEFDEEYWGHVSPEAKDLIKSMLTVDPSARASAVDVLKNEWMEKHDFDLSKTDLGLNLAELRKSMDKSNRAFFWFIEERLTFADRLRKTKM